MTACAQCCGFAKRTMLLPDHGLLLKVDCRRFISLSGKCKKKFQKTAKENPGAFLSLPGLLNRGEVKRGNEGCARANRHTHGGPPAARARPTSQRAKFVMRPASGRSADGKSMAV